MLETIMSDNLKLVGIKIFGNKFLELIIHSKHTEPCKPFNEFFNNIIVPHNCMATKQVETKYNDLINAHGEYNLFMNDIYFQYVTSQTLYDNMREELADFIIAMSVELSLDDDDDVSNYENLFEVIISWLDVVTVESIVTALYRKVKGINEAYNTYVKMFNAPKDNKPWIYQVLLTEHSVADINNKNNAFKIIKTIRTFNKMVKMNDLY